MRRIGATGLAMMMVGLASCGGGTNAGVRHPAPADAGKAEAKWAKEWAHDAEGSGRGIRTAGGSSDAMEMAPSAASGKSTSDGYSATDGPVLDPGPPVSDPVVVPPADTTLSAGSTDDNAKWEEYLQYREQMLRAGVHVHDVDVSTREIVHVVDRDGHPVLGAHVELRRGDTVVATRTSYADGRVLFFPRASTDQSGTSSYTITATLGDTHVEAALDPETHEHTLRLDSSQSRAEPVPLDVLFLIDATGSMGDEIEQLKANMVSVAEQINKLSPRPDVRFGMTVFRDRGDAFVTRTFDLTGDVDSFVTALRAVVADGGGDTPESVNAGLHDALNAAHWRGDNTVKMIFLVGDAAPHLDYPHDYDYAHEMEVAAQRGIKIDPIASSGLDDQGEFIFRQLAQYTTGRFNFLTYGADGHSPGTSTPHHVEGYDVLSLDQLVVRLVTEELGGAADPPAGQ